MSILLDPNRGEKKKSFGFCKAVEMVVNVISKVKTKMICRSRITSMKNLFFLSGKYYIVSTVEQLITH